MHESFVLIEEPINWLWPLCWDKPLKSHTLGTIALRCTQMKIFKEVFAFLPINRWMTLPRCQRKYQGAFKWDTGFVCISSVKKNIHCVNCDVLKSSSVPLLVAAKHRQCKMCVLSICDQFLLSKSIQTKATVSKPHIQYDRNKLTCTKTLRIDAGHWLKLRGIHVLDLTQ